MQPTYLPWMGYFDLMDSVDTFVILDQVQFEKQSWQNRNRMRTAKELEWLSVPILNTGHSGQLISETQIASGQFVEKHLRSLKQSYGRAKYFNAFFPELENCLRESASAGRIADLNIGLIRMLSKRLGIARALVLASELGVQGKRSALLVNICEKISGSVYLSPIGSADYLREDRSLFDGAGIQVFLQNYQHPIYDQVYKPFLPYASVVDLIFNEGNRALEIIRAGRKEEHKL